MSRRRCLTRRSVLGAGSFFAVGLASRAWAAPGELFDIGSGGTPSIQGNLGGGVTLYNPGLHADLQVTVDFGDVSPINRSAIVRAVVPIAIRSEESYELHASVTSGATQPLGLQLSDIGFGLQNFRRMARGRDCNNHVITAPFDNDPAQTVNRAGRASYPCTLASIQSQSLLRSGPELSQGKVKDRKPDNGWLFDAAFTVVPQFFVPDSASFTVNFFIRAGAANVKCG